MTVALMLATPLAMRAADGPDESSSKKMAAEGRTIPLVELIEQVSRRTNTQFVVDPRVRAEVPLAGMDASRVDLDRLRAILRVHQFVAFQEKGFISVAPDANARQLPTRTYYDLNYSAPDDEPVTLVIEARNICSPHTVPVLRPLMPQAAHLAAMPPRSLIISDRSINARRIAEIFQKLDQAAPAAKPCEWPPAESKPK
jgi:general secretion pathway protein D